MNIEPRQPTRNGPAELFTGDAYIDVIHVRKPEPSRMACNRVHFAPGARTAWHSHALGQTLYITAAAWYLNPVTPALDSNQQVLQNQEIAEVTTFARTGNPSAQNTPIWPEFNTSAEVMSLAPSDDSETMSITQIEADHNCGFWDSIAPST